MLLRKGRIVERRRVAYRLVGLVRGEAHVLSRELYADAHEAQAAVESAVPEHEPLEQVTLQRGEESDAGAAPADASGARSSPTDPLGCRWEVIKRWGPDVIARIRRQRFGHAAVARFPLIAEPATPTKDVDDTPSSEVIPAPRAEHATIADVESAAVPAPGSEQVDRTPASAATGAPIGDPCIDEALNAPEIGPTPTPILEPVHAADPATEPIDAPIIAEAPPPKSPAAPEEAPLVVPAAAEPSSAKADEAGAIPSAPLEPRTSAPPAASEIETAAAPAIDPTPTPLARRRSRGAVIRTSAAVTLLLLAILLFETCSNPFGWLTGAAAGDEVRTLPFTNQPAARPNRPDTPPRSLSANNP